jgi:RHS repeat-associated protein
VENNFRFLGQYYDEETGLHYNYFRYYDPSIGRYLEADPIGQSGGLNLYAYAGNDPVNAVDPMGLFNYYDYLGSPANQSDERRERDATLYAYENCMYFCKQSYEACKAKCRECIYYYSDDFKTVARYRHSSTSSGGEEGSIRSLHKSVEPLRYAMGSMPQLNEAAETANKGYKINKEIGPHVDNVKTNWDTINETIGFTKDGYPYVKDYDRFEKGREGIRNNAGPGVLKMIPIITNDKLKTPDPLMKQFME